MARKKITVSSSFWPKQFNFGESYTSLLLGLVVVVVLAIVIVVFGKYKNVFQFSQPKPEVSSEKTEALKKENGFPKDYTVALGDTLWNIAEKTYKSGYNWVDIARANNLENPDVLHAGTKLVLPKAEKKVVATQGILSQKTQNAPSEIKSPAVQNNKITGSSYTVARGDYLWNIAVRAYGDGYRWVDIARENKLVNPNIIHSGNVFKIPR